MNRNTTTATVIGIRQDPAGDWVLTADNDLAHTAGKDWDPDKLLRIKAQVDRLLDAMVRAATDGTLAGMRTELRDPTVDPADYGGRCK